MGEERHKESEREKVDGVELIFRGCDYAVYNFTEHNQPSKLLNKLSFVDSVNGSEKDRKHYIFKQRSPKQLVMSEGTVAL